MAIEEKRGSTKNWDGVNPQLGWRKPGTKAQLADSRATDSDEEKDDEEKSDDDEEGSDDDEGESDGDEEESDGDEEEGDGEEEEVGGEEEEGGDDDDDAPLVHPPDRDYAVGKLVAAKYRDDNWYAAIINKLREDKKQVDLTFCGKWLDEAKRQLPLKYIIPDTDPMYWAEQKKSCPLPAS